MSQKNSSLLGELAQDEMGNESMNQTTTTRRRMTTLPISRVSCIMRQCPNTSTIKSDAVGIMAKAAEMFLLDLVKGTYQVSKMSEPNLTKFKYQDFAEYVNHTDFKFLKPIIPKKISFYQYKTLSTRSYQIQRNAPQESEDEESD